MLQNIVQWLIDHYGHEQFQPGLSRMEKALGSLLPELQKKKIITVAGTNGKGETSLRLNSHLRDRKFCTWISPHIERVTERFVSEKGEIDLQELERLILQCHETVVQNKYQLSFYEFLFFVFCTWAVENKSDILVLEVGLGGRLDAVNVLDADILLLPSISRDHQEFLGRRYDQILKEKLALLRPKTILLSFLDLHYLRERTQVLINSIGATHQDLNLLYDIPHWDFSRRNQVLAHAAFCVFEGKNPDLQFQSLTMGIEHRGEVIQANGEWIFFGPHNPDGLRKLILFLHSGNYNFTRPPYARVITSFSRRDRKDLDTMVKMLKHSGLGKIELTHFPHPKAASKEVMESLASQEGLDFVQSIDSYVHGKNEGPVLVLGSYYFMGHVQSIIRGQ